MSFTTELLDAARQAQGMPSDYRLAQVLGVTRSTVSGWRVGRKFPSVALTCELAKLAKMEMGAALLGVAMDRHDTPEGRRAFREMWRTPEHADLVSD